MAGIGKQGRGEVRRFLGAANGKPGKALRNDTPIPTADGWRMMSGLQVGDTVFTEEGFPTEVLGVYPQDITDCWEVQFTTGDAIAASGDHLWVVLDAVESKRRTRSDVLMDTGGFEGWADAPPRTTLDLTERLYRGAVHNWSIPIAGALELPKAELPVDPYMLGVWLGDGNHKAPRVTCHEDDEPTYAEAARQAGLPWHSHYQAAERVVSVSLSGEAADGTLLRHSLQGLGVWGNKHIPSVYQRSSYRQRLELLRGLMDTDGSIVAKAGGPSRSASLGFSNERLACEARQLVASLGMKPSRLARRETDAKDHWTFVFVALAPVFRLPRKRGRNRSLGPASPKALQRRIVSIDRVDDAETTCIKVANPSGLFLAGDAMIPTHNTNPAGGGMRLTGLGA